MDEKRFLKMVTREETVDAQMVVVSRKAAPVSPLPGAAKSTVPR